MMFGSQHVLPGPPVHLSLPCLYSKYIGYKLWFVCLTQTRVPLWLLVCLWLPVSHAFNTHLHHW